jgi:hypothetical protein
LIEVVERVVATSAVGADSAASATDEARLSAAKNPAEVTIPAWDLRCESFDGVLLSCSRSGDTDARGAE